MPQQMNRKSLKHLLQAESLDRMTYEELASYFREDLNQGFLPQNFYCIDPRNGDRVVFSSARMHRPHDNQPPPTSVANSSGELECPICNGQTTKVIDVADLSQGFTFINKNLYPIFFPAPKTQPLHTVPGNALENIEQGTASGFHFLQWTSSVHDHDWQNMPLADRIVVMRRLAALEHKLITTAGGYVSIIKNFGHLVGGSLTHPHQQITLSGVIPNRHHQNKLFMEQHHEAFSAYILRENPSEFLIRDYGPAVLLTPYFMRRPFDMLLIIKDAEKSYLHQLSEDELNAVVDGWQDAIRVMLAVLPEMGRERAYNITTHNGPGAGLYFEFLPYTQEMGGFEHLGLYVCQGNPRAAAGHARDLLAVDKRHTS